ncbi:MAG: glycosyltransferase family A protein [Firmicutes bacterium]|nr:glycosyltransferase family A protein [Bacillota bacterium]
MASVSVVIPVFNQADLVGATVQAVLNGRVQPAEVIIVNDGSQDDPHRALRVIQETAPVPVKVMDIPHGGPGRARDAGWRAAQGEIIAFTDADALPHPEWLFYGLSGFSAPEVGAVEGKVVSSGVPTVFTHQVHNEFGGQFMTANMLYRRAVIEEVGGFKSRYREDSDLAFSVIERGYEIRFVPEAVVYHPPRRESWTFYFKKANRKRYEALLFRRHPQVAARYIPRFQPTELLILGGELLCLLTIWLGAWSATAGLALLAVGLPKRIAAWLNGRVYSGRDYLLVWILTLVLVPVEAYYHWTGWIKPPR